MANWESKYEDDLGSLTKSESTVFTKQQKMKNTQLRDCVRDLLPIDDDYKVSDCDLLYRFLIGHKWDCEIAERLLRQYVRFRKEDCINGILAEEPHPRITPLVSVFYGVDKNCHPVFWVTPDPAILISLLKEFPKKELIRAQIRVLEQARYLIKAYGVDRCVCVINFEKVNMASVNATTLGFVRSLNIVLQNFYPEVFHRILIFNSNWAVTCAWKVLKPFVDIRVQEKLRFLGGSPSPKILGEFMDTDSILPEFGGTGTVDILGGMLKHEKKRLHEASRTGFSLSDALVSENAHVNPASISSSLGFTSVSTFKPAGVLPISVLGDSNKSPLNSVQDAGNFTSGTEASDYCDDDVTLYSICSCVADRQMSGNSAKEHIIIGVPDVLDFAAHNQSVAPPLAEKSENMDYLFGSSLNLSTCGDCCSDYTVDNARSSQLPCTAYFEPKHGVEKGNLAGYCGNVCIGIFTQGRAYCKIGLLATSLDRETSQSTSHVGHSPLSTFYLKPISANFSSTAGSLSALGWKFAGELLWESMHLIHRYIIVCDSVRHARFVLKRGVMHKQLTIFRVLKDCTVHTNSRQKHSVSKKRMKVAVVVADKNKARNADGWVMLGRGMGGHRPFSWYLNSCENVSYALSESDSWEKGAPGRIANNYVSERNTNEIIGKHEGDNLLALCKDGVVSFYGPLARTSFEDVFPLVVAITRLWDRAKTEALAPRDTSPSRSPE